MLTIDLRQSPPSHHELAAERQRLTVEKQRLLKYAMLSDAGHGGSLLLLYFANILSGPGLLTTIILGTAVMIVLLTKRNRMSRAGFPAVFIAALFVSLATGAILFYGLNEGYSACLLVGVIVASSVFCSVRIGSRLLNALDGLDGLNPLAENELALQEMHRLCRTYAALEDYRQQALDILRPQLTFAELEAMRQWVADQSQLQK